MSFSMLSISNILIHINDISTNIKYFTQHRQHAFCNDIKVALVSI